MNAYLDGELGGKEREAVKRHLADCQSCRTVLQSLDDLEPALLAAGVPPPPSDLTSRIMSVASADRSSGAKKPSRRLTDKLWFPDCLLKGATAAALIVGLAMGAYMGWHSFGAEKRVRSGTTGSVDLSADNLLYVYDVMRAAPSNSIEAAVFRLLNHER